MKTIRKVAIVLRMSGAAGRDILSGIFRFTRANAHWQTRLFQMPDEFTTDRLETLLAEKYDGVIASEIATDDVDRRLARTGLPVAFIGEPTPALAQRTENLALIRNDDTRIGNLGARFLASLGNFRAYGFVPGVSNRHWSREREAGFCKELNSRGHEATVFRSPADSAGSPEDLDALRRWLVTLPKPAAVMAAWDMRAVQTLQQATDAGFRVPQQVMLLGVDNDELLAEASDPPLTTIQPNHEKLGFVAARELARLMSRRQHPVTICVPAEPIGIVERETTSTATPAAHILTRAMQYIRKHATEGIGANDVAKFLGVSRRLVELRFREFADETINEACVRIRLEAVKKILSTTNRPVKSIATACGFGNSSYLMTLFKRRFGLSMRDWRLQNRQ